MEYENDDLLDAYLDGTLFPDARARFEAALGQDEALRRELELHRDARTIIETAAMKAALGRIHQTLAQEATATPAAAQTGARRTIAFRPRRIWQAAAAAAIIGIGVAAWLMQGGGNSRLYDKYYTQDAGLPGLMGSTSNYTLDDAMVDYKSGAYSQAIDKLRTLQQQGASGDTTVYYLAMAYLGNKQFERAQATLLPLTQKENTFRAKALWYAALSDLRLKKKAEAHALLRTIAADSTNIQASAAQALLAEWPE